MNLTCGQCLDTLSQIEIQSGRGIRDHYDRVFQHVRCFMIIKDPNLPPLCHRADQLYLSHLNTMFHQPPPNLNPLRY